MSGKWVLEASKVQVVFMFGSILLSSGVMQSILLAFYFFERAEHAQRLRLHMGHFFFLFTLIMAVNLAFYTGGVKELPHLIKTGYVLGSFCAPVFYFAAVNYFGIPRENNVWRFIYFLPAVMLLLYCLPFFLQSAETKFSYIDLVAKKELLSEAGFLQIFTLAYNFLIFLRAYLRFGEISKEFSQASLQEITLFTKYVLIVVIWLFLSILLSISLPGPTSEGIISVGFSIWILGFAWHRVYKDQMQSVRLERERQKDEAKYQKSYLKEDRLQELGEYLEQLLKKEEVILDSELSLSKISELLGISIHLTSQVLNRYFNEGFIEIIRKRRIEIAKRLLRESELPILRVGFDVGFNSKNSFLRAFKEIEDLTPSEYRKLFEPSIDVNTQIS